MKEVFKVERSEQAAFCTSNGSYKKKLLNEYKDDLPVRNRSIF